MIILVKNKQEKQKLIDASKHLSDINEYSFDENYVLVEERQLDTVENTSDLDYYEQEVLDVNLHSPLEWFMDLHKFPDRIIVKRGIK